jgi:hypothetical protein
VDAEPSWSRRPPLERASLGIAFVGAVRRGAVIDVRRSLRDSYERWVGKGAIGAREEETRWAVLLEELLA